MGSLVEGYSYDVFISYRQKDNKGDRWVSEFVEALKTELESTFKEQVSVYFDINPGDYLLESYDVDASLKEKLKCLVFIPVLSRTYCDSKSFAWVHEFKAFVGQASKDQFGLKVKLPNGNVASRVLPVRIHDLDATDIKECESVLGGVLRGIEFIYREAGIDKPLAPDDDEKKNLNKTRYRIQLIKVAHSVREIILGMKNEPAYMDKENKLTKDSSREDKAWKSREVLQKPPRAGRVGFLIPTAIFILVLIAGIFAYPKIFKRNTVEKLRAAGERICVAVMPFQNLTNDTAWNVWQWVIQDNLVTYLSSFPDELKVRQKEAVNILFQGKDIVSYASFSPPFVKAISQKLGANIFIYGSLQQAGSNMRVSAKVVDTKSEEVLKSFELDGPNKEDSILIIADSLRKKITDYLRISRLKEGIAPDMQNYYSAINTSSPEAYKRFIYANEAVSNGDPVTAVKLYKEVLAIDSGFVVAKIFMTAQYYFMGLYADAKKHCLEVYKQIDNIPLICRGNVKWLYACLFETPYEGIKVLKQYLQTFGELAVVHYLMGIGYCNIYQFDNATTEFEKVFKLNKEWNTEPTVSDYLFLGFAYHKAGQYHKERRLYKNAIKKFQDNYYLIYRQAVLALSERDTEEASMYIDKYISLTKERSASETVIAGKLAEMYDEAGMPDKAEEYYRSVLLSEPDNPVNLNNLAWFLIDRNRNIDEGMILVEKALNKSPGTGYMLDTKGWGLYKQGKYREARDILQKCWDLQPIYNHEIFIHLEAAKKAVAGMN